MMQPAIVVANKSAYGATRTTTYSIPELTRTAKAEVRIVGGRSLSSYHVLVDERIPYPVLVVEYRQKDGTAAVVRIVI